MTGPASPAGLLSPERAPLARTAPLGKPREAGPELTIVVPTLNERDNVGPLFDRLDRLLEGVDWEAVFVDDDSADGTAEHLREFGRSDRRIRCIRRFGRRGLSSACIEGILSTSARYIAVIDGDLQHDETLLPRMLDILKRQQADIVVASRYVASGAADGLSAKRRMLSRAGVRLARVLLKSDITDPVSGFFMMRSEVVEKAAARLSGVGTKILIDLLCSSPGSLSVAELPYRFRGRYSGSSKLDWLTVLEYLALLAEKVSGRYLPSKFLLFGLVGASGVVVHLVVLRVLLASAGTGFCRRPISCDGNRDGLELLQQHLDLSRLPARRLGGIAWSPLLYGDLRPRCRRQCPGGSRLVRNLPALAVPRSEQLCAHLDVHLGRRRS